MNRVSYVMVAGLAVSLGASSPVRAQDSDEAFQTFLDALETARQVVLDNTSGDGTDRAEGMRHIIRLVEMQNAPATDDHDPAHPHVGRCPSVVCKVGFDNPDFTYISVAPIRADYSYRITGKRGTVPYISMQVFDNPLGGEVFMTSEDLVVKPDGSYEIILSADEPEEADNWMRLNEGASRFILRNGFYDWDNEIEASVRVEVIDGPMNGPVPSLTPEELGSDVQALATRLSFIPQQMQSSKATWPLNDVNGPDPAAFGIPGAGIPSAYSSAGRYEVAQGEALIIESREGNVIHGGIQLGNEWVESFDYQSRQTSLNWFQSHLDDDGVYRYVLAHEDPGVPNWLDISDHPTGTLFMRWQSPPEDALPVKPAVAKVAYDKIRETLPADHPTVTPEERAEILRNRYIAVNKRRNPTAQFDDVAQPSSDGGGCSAMGLRGSNAGWMWAVIGFATVVRRRRRQRQRPRQ